jgi:hypothetical protein
VTEAYAHPRPRRRRGRRLLVTLLVLLALLGIGLAVADRVAVAFAENRISDEIASGLADQQVSSAKPEVTITGVPFLTQVLAGRYAEIDVRLRDFAGSAGGGKTVQLPVLDVAARDVRAPLKTLRTGQGDVVAQTVTGVGTLAYADLAALFGRKGLTLGERAGRLTVSTPFEALGQQVTLTGTADLSIQGDVLRVRIDELNADELASVPFAQQLVSAYAKQISVDLKLPDLPMGLRVQKVEPRPAGIAVTAGARDVALNSAGR